MTHKILLLNHIWYGTQQNFVIGQYIVRYTMHTTLLMTVHIKYRLIIKHIIDD